MVAYLIWILFPCAAIWLGLYVLKSAVWAFALYHGLCLFPVIIKERKLWLPSVRPPRPSHLFFICLASTCFAAVALGVYNIAGLSLLSDAATISLLRELGYDRGTFFWLSAYAVVVNPLLEEIYWRGIVLNRIESRKEKFPHEGVLLSSFGYALFHYLIFRLVLFPGWAELGTVMLAVYGAVLSVIYKRSGSIVTVAIAHGALTDLSAIALILSLSGRHPGSL